MRKSGKNDFTVTVEGIGTFTFANRTLNDELRIQSEYAKIINGVEVPTTWLYQLGLWMSVLRVLMVASPEGWDLEGLDPLDDDTYENIEKVFRALRDKEDSFRGKSRKGGETAGESPVQDSGVLVPSEVQPAAE